MDKLKQRPDLPAWLFEGAWQFDEAQAIEPFNSDRPLGLFSKQIRETLLVEEPELQALAVLYAIYEDYWCLALEIKQDAGSLFSLGIRDREDETDEGTVYAGPWHGHGEAEPLVEFFQELRDEKYVICECNGVAWCERPCELDSLHTRQHLQKLEKEWLLAEGFARPAMIQVRSFAGTFDQEIRVE